MVGMPVINFAAIKPMGNPAARDLFSNLAEGAGFVDNLRAQKNAQKQAQLMNALKEAQLQNLPAEQQMAARMGEADIGQKLAHTNLFRAQAQELPYKRGKEQAKSDAAAKKASIWNYVRWHSTMTPDMKNDFFSKPKNVLFHNNMMNLLRQDIQQSGGPEGEIPPEYMQMMQGQGQQGQSPQGQMPQGQIPEDGQVIPGQMPGEVQMPGEGQMGQDQIPQLGQEMQAQPGMIPEQPQEIPPEQFSDTARTKVIRDRITPQARQQMDAAINSYHMFKGIDFDKLTKDASKYMGKFGKQALLLDKIKGKQSALNYSTWTNQVIPNLVNQLRKIEGLGVDQKTREELEKIFQIQDPSFVGLNPELARKYSMQGVRLVKQLEKAYLAPFLKNKRDAGVLRRVYGVDYSKEGRRPSAAIRRRKPTASTTLEEWSFNK